MSALSLTAAWQRLLAPRATPTPVAHNGSAAIRRLDPIDDSSDWVRSRDRARFHLGRARRARDRGRYRDATREIERALRYDDTSEAYFLVLGQCQLKADPADPAAARRTFERAFQINPRNSYTLKLLTRCYETAGDLAAAIGTLERALAAGAPAIPWCAELARYRAGRD